jgi:hypothetical protein
MTPERLALIEGNIALGWGGAPAAELIADIRRLWTVLEAARTTMKNLHPDSNEAWDLGTAISAYDCSRSYSAAAQHPGQLTLGGGEGQ